MGAVRNAGGKAIARMLVEAGADVNATNSEGWTPLFFASRSGDEKNRKTVLHHGQRPNINIRSMQGDTPLLYAASRRVAQLLVAHGLKVNVKINAGVTPLYNAFKNAIAEAEEGAVDFRQVAFFLMEQDTQVLLEDLEELTALFRRHSIDLDIASFIL